MTSHQLKRGIVILDNINKLDEEIRTVYNFCVTCMNEDNDFNKKLFAQYNKFKEANNIKIENYSKELQSL